MPFWGENYTGGDIKDPKRKFRFRVDFQGLGEGNSFLWWAKTVTVPSYDVSEVEHNFYDNKFYYYCNSDYIIAVYVVIIEQFMRTIIEGWINYTLLLWDNELLF